MEINASKIARILKRLKTAVGYHELGMTQHALRCLDSLTSLGRIGPFGLVKEVLRGEFGRNREDHIPAAKALEIVACMLPAPARNAITMTLAACYGQGNELERGVKGTARDRGAKPEGTRNPAC
jgi:hypothetical protein